MTELWVHKFCKFGSFSDSMNIMQMELLNEQQSSYHEILSKNILNANVSKKVNYPDHGVSVVFIDLGATPLK